MALDDNILRERISEMQPEENVMTYGKSSTVLAPRRRGAGQLPSLFAAGWTRYSNGTCACIVNTKTCLCHQGATTGDPIHTPVDGDRA